MQRSHRIRAVAAICVLAASGVASPQDGDGPRPAPAARPAPPAPAPPALPAPPAQSATALGARDAHKVRGVLAWRKGVWTSDRAAYARAVKELEAVRGLDPADADVTVLFLLGHSYTRLGDAVKAEAPLDRARRIAPDFPGHWLGEALRLTADKPSFTKHERTVESIGLLDRYLVEIARYDRTAPFAAELEYLGWLERGLRQFAMEAVDRGLADLGRAWQIVAAQDRRPSIELVRTLAECHSRVQQIGESEKLLEDALHADPGEPSHYHMLGRTAAEQRKSDLARTWYRRAVARRADYVEPRVKLAYLSWEAGDLYDMRCQLEAYEAAWKDRWAQGEARSPNVEANLESGWGTYWQRRGDLRIEAGDVEGGHAAYREAKARFIRAQAQNPGCVRALSELVKVLTLLQAPQDEIQGWLKKLQQIRETKPDASEVYRDTFC